MGVQVWIARRTTPRANETKLPCVRAKGPPASSMVPIGPTVVWQHTQLFVEACVGGRIQTMIYPLNISTRPVVDRVHFTIADGALLHVWITCSRPLAIIPLFILLSVVSLSIGLRGA